MVRNKRISRLLIVIKSSKEKIAKLFGFCQELRGITNDIYYSKRRIKSEKSV
mgnify:CR=1 FL=1